jgi:hypothetical protein
MPTVNKGPNTSQHRQKQKLPWPILSDNVRKSLKVNIDYTDTINWNWAICGHM